MASALGHAATAWAFSKWVSKPTYTTKLLVVGIICAILPDADVLAFKFGIPYESPWGHRGFTHSISFAVGFALLITPTLFSEARKNYKPFLIISLFLFLCLISHGLLDALTTGGKGVGFFIPFDDNRYFLPWQVIKVSPLSINQFFSEWGEKVIISELLWIGFPALIVGVVGMFHQRRNNNLR